MQLMSRRSSDGFLGGFKIVLSEANGDDYELSSPSWFPGAISTLVLFVAWRKTRPKINPKMAFPVEVGEQHD